MRDGGSWDRTCIQTPRFRNWFASGQTLASFASPRGGSDGGGGGGGGVVAQVAVAVRRASWGVIVVGPLSSAAERAAVLHLAARLDWPLIADLQVALWHAQVHFKFFFFSAPL